MAATSLPTLRDQLLERRDRLNAAIVTTADADAARLLREVDAALARMAAGTFGLCDVCGEPIEADRLWSDPLTRLCLDHLTPHEQRALEQDLELASRIQRELLPRRDIRLDGWEMAYYYEPAGPVSGDYCDLIPGATGDVYFVLGDVSGKGIAAAMLMSHLSATLRTLVSVGLPLRDIMERASRMFCESTPATHYATLVCGHASATGDVEVANAGHPAALVLRAGGVVRLDATGLPVGMFCSEQFSSHTVRLAAGESILVYTDGLVEARSANGTEYGVDRLCALAASASGRSPQALLDACVADLTTFRGAASGSRDDLTIMAVRRA